MVRWYMDDDDDEDDVLKPERLLQRTDRGAGWHHVQQFMHGSDDDRYWPFFKDCIGALDGTHISVRPPKRNAEAYRGRKQEPTMNVLAICNFDMKFIYAFVGVPGRAHDTKVLTYCARNEPFFPHPPNGKYYLVDAGYPTRTGYLGPYRRVRYHLDQFNRGGPPTNTREVFNRRHSSMRSVIERTFGVWKAKWRILDRRHPKYGLIKWIKLVTSTMTLHNFIRDSHREDNDFVRWQRREEYHTHGDDDDDENEDEEEKEEDGDGHGGHIPYEPTGDRAMEGLRDHIGNELSRGYRLPY